MWESPTHWPPGSGRPLRRSSPPTHRSAGSSDEDLRSASAIVTAAEPIWATFPARASKSGHECCRTRSAPVYIGATLDGPNTPGPNVRRGSEPRRALVAESGRELSTRHGRPHLVRSRRVADRDLGARTRPKAAAWRRACRAEQGPCPAERDACRRTKAGRHGGAGTSKPSSPARHAAETCAGLVSSGPSEISCAGGIALAARGCFAKSSSVRSGRRWKTVTRCSPLLILYRTEGSHEALSLAA
jgi:hypothetical protein